ncbi:DUF805 domain-containing protein [Sphingomonas sp. ID1715]|uniref:DUF805 domain-containing protein n=1 Tax=Sphingomonas sp. ID1715 TaxID=1656898 RepID=UPI001487F9E1|nr:DUF805 domain-containing protein [Sphingomonas sp. ID1715]NNM75382.1 DUF805 domain-containing protein [Sphingomonas sp. ID1715]
MEWALLPLKRYADFSGRSRRKEFWFFTLLVWLVAMVLLFVSGLGAAITDPTSFAAQGGFGLGLILLILFSLALFIPGLAVQVRRFHDQDKSGWFVLLNFIPYIGGIVVLVFMCLEGTRGPNRYGPDPKEGDLAAAAE